MSNLEFIKSIVKEYQKAPTFKVMFRSIQNPIDTPWLDWIESGVKTFEGRLNKGTWKKIKPSDIIIWTDQNKKTVITQIRELKYYSDFASAFNDLGSKLVPIPNANEKLVKKLYSRYFTDADVKKFGVVAIGVDLI